MKRFIFQFFLSLIILIICLVAMAFSLSSCTLEQSEDQPLNVYLTGIGSDNITVNWYTTNITESTSTNLTGILVAEDGGITVADVAAADLVGINESQELDNKTLDSSTVKGTWTNSGTWTIPAVTLNGDIDCNGQYLHGDAGVYIDSDYAWALNLYTDEDGQDGAGIRSLWNSATPADNDYSAIILRAQNDGSEYINYVTLYRYLSDVSDGSEDGAISWKMYDDGSNTTVMTLNGDGNLWVENDCSALTFTDRTKYFDGDAVGELIKVKGKDGEVDHNSLPEFTKAKIKIPIFDVDGNIIGSYEADGRDLGATISMLTVAIKQLNERIEYLESKTK